VQHGAGGPSDEYTSLLYSTIERWWGEELSLTLAKKASAAPAYQIRAFWEEMQQACVYRSPVLPDMRPGTLRPLIGSNLLERKEPGLSSSVALRLLLYVHEVALESDPLDRVFAPKPVNRATRKALHLTLSQLADLRPFVYQGLVHFTLVRSPALHPGYSGWEAQALTNPRVRNMARNLASGLEYSNDEMDDGLLRGILISLFTAQKMGLMRMSEGRANPLSRTEAERELLKALLFRNLGDDRYLLMSTLAQLPVPDFSDDPKLLTQLRTNDDKFNAWRQKLGAALSDIGEMPDSANFGEASAIVRTELLSALTDVERSTKQSPVLQAARHGVVQFGVGAVGAVPGLVTGSPVAGLVGAASTALANTVVQSLQALRARRSDRLVLALAASFDTKK